ncbi:MAG: 3-hydroxyacyl-CoA dehydrogenase NAD-binding domain-containing protein [Pseudohongiellaceae bacterium]|nr:3-hydroxyacyl-CoA dehydrogenase NAD-binding domain-containing protein [Pseudohongiellaceae bacterium]
MTAQVPHCSHWRVDIDADNLLWLYLDRQGESVNALSTEVLLEFDQLLDFIESVKPEGVAILSGKPKGFILGADITEFDKFSSAEDVERSIRQAHQIFTRFESLPCPTVVAFQGYCLGGGLELALCAKYRIAKDIPTTKIGFPEIQLGIFPGFGGSARSVQTLGGLRAMELMLSTRQIGASQAKRIGLIDQKISRHQELYWAARKALLNKRRSARASLLQRASNWSWMRKILARQMRNKTAQRARETHYPAPYRLIDTWEQYGHSKQQMLEAEIQEVSKLMQTPQAEGLRHVFHLLERLKKQGRQSDHTIRRVHIIGAGVMGGDIAAWCAYKGLEVSLQDRELEYITPALKRAETLFRKKRLAGAQLQSAKARIQADPQGERVPMADLVIEVIIEDAQAKRELFTSIEPRLKPGALLATNTSSIPLEEIASVLQDPSRLIGLHFFNPVAQMPLVEVVHSQYSSEQALALGAGFCDQIARYPLPVKSSPGFLVNRVLAPYMLEAMLIHQEGVPIEAIDAAAKDFGMPMGPVELADTVGLDVCAMVMKTLGGESSKDDKIQLAIDYLNDLVKKKRLGKKSGRGFYRWHNGKAKKDKSLAQHAEKETIIQRLIDRYTNECEAALLDKIVDDEELVDAGMVFGTGFAPFRGGPMHYKHKRQQA